MSIPAFRPATIAAYEADLISNHLGAAVLAAACYEYMITIHHEYMFLWQRKWTLSTWLFITNRYVVLASVIAQGVPYSAVMCVPVRIVWCQVTSSALQMLQHAPTFLSECHICSAAVHFGRGTTAFSALRVFALLDHAYISAGCVFILALTPAVLTLYEAHYFTYYYVDGPALVNLANVLTTIASDIAALAATWIKAYRHVREASSVGVHTGFGVTLIRYGTFYFVEALCSIVCLTHVAGLVSPLIYPFAALTSATNTSEITIIPNIVISRFLISLSQVNRPAPSDVSNFSRFSVSNFRIPTLPEFIDTLGEPLANSRDDVLYDEEPRDADCEEERSDAGPVRTRRCREVAWSCDLRNMPKPNNFTPSGAPHYTIISGKAARQYPSSAYDNQDISIYRQKLAGLLPSTLRTDTLQTLVRDQPPSITSTFSSSAIAAAYATELTINYCACSALVFVCYEFVITLQHEYEFLWLRKRSVSTWLFVLNRYAMLGIVLQQAVPYSPQFIAAVGLAAILSATVADIIAVLTTWLKTYRHVKQAASVGAGASFGVSLLQYGTLYFIVICLVNVASLPVLLVVTLCSIQQPNESFYIPVGPSSVFNRLILMGVMNSLPNIIISRFLINLHQASLPESSNTTSSHFSAPNFRAPTLPEIIGNLGEPLTFGDEVEHDGIEVGDAESCEECLNHIEGNNEAARGTQPSGDGSREIIQEVRSSCNASEP
ncbi:hypothetical protein NM688_g4013 [Phlebia brevispora]|uniref:Uncharacterized protein n=1 Tax=Phlebia brevispora TaxID=194682 RepID=A0ACC1T4T0_9APHY|nr:hypothetical protein NM688_g4013 [Phlebia brevispora]